MKKPMLAVDAPASIAYPVFASPKIDGIRCIVFGGIAYSRSGKPLPNKYVQKMLAGYPDGTDGEIVVGGASALDVFRKTTSGIMSVDGEPDFTFIVFDNCEVAGGYASRLKTLENALPQTLIESSDALAVFEAECVAQGFEGVILRAVDAPYKHGRSTAKEGYLLKVKRFSDSEARVIGIEELVRKDGAMGCVLGALVAEDLRTGIVFRIGTGFSEEDRRELWLNPPIGKIARYAYFAHGVVSAPRHPVFSGFRDVIDI